jgi:hypothetical protein
MLEDPRCAAPAADLTPGGAILAQGQLPIARILAPLLKWLTWTGSADNRPYSSLLRMSGRLASSAMGSNVRVLGRNEGLPSRQPSARRSLEFVEVKPLSFSTASGF